MPNRTRTRNWTMASTLANIAGAQALGRAAVASPSGKPSQSLRTLTQHLIDYAGLFPPAGLDMKAAVENFLAYRQVEHSWILGRFIVPATRLGELGEVIEQVGGEQTLWKISGILGPNLLGDLAMVRNFNQMFDGRAMIDSLEMKASSLDDIRRAREYIDRSMMLYIEVPTAVDPVEMLEGVKLANAYAKVRTGGLDETMFPPAGELARFLVTCATDKVAFKATAGLHHPVRCVKPFTSERDSASGTMHGFLNLFVAAGIARGGASEADVAAVLETNSSERFVFGDEGVTVLVREKLEFHISTELLHETRRSFAASFGSCSFQEPIEELRAIGLL